MNKLSLISLIVKDYDAALEFYTQKLGFEVAEDEAFGNRRWITLKLTNTPDSAINLELARSKDDEALIAVSPS